MCLTIFLAALSCPCLSLTHIVFQREVYCVIAMPNIVFEQEVYLVIAMPHMSFRINNRKQHKQYVLMMSSDYERSDWTDAIAGLLQKGTLALIVFVE